MKNSNEIMMENNVNNINNNDNNNDNNINNNDNNNKYINKIIYNNNDNNDIIMITIKNLIKYITSGTLSRPAGAFWANNLIKIHKIGHIIHPKLNKNKKK